ncbi:hypothetical protein PoMZ_03511 [Pyricularia oryzae]|uniref:Uncharacterized protein n=1 Tax=Pyricularia oryzae TaxID=318829 RepID=A0A4P7NBR4_PYROR|nr:hypothetical protein PoMZ_03511 [Pyricularia oryzae]
MAAVSASGSMRTGGRPDYLVGPGFYNVNDRADGIGLSRMEPSSCGFKSRAHPTAIAAAAWTVLYHVSRLSFEIVGELHLTYGTANLLTEALIIAGLGFVVRSLPNKNVGVLLGSRGLCLIFTIGSLSTQASDYYLGRLLQQISDNISIVSICLPMIVQFMEKNEQNKNIQDPRISSMGHLHSAQSLSTLSSNRQNDDFELGSVENIMRG